MSVNFSVAVRNARLNAIETEAGTSAILKVRSGAKPTACADADAGTVGATMNLPADYFADAASGEKAKAGTWEDTAGDAAITAGHWRLYKSDGTTCVAQGTCSGTGGGGDMELDNTSIAVGQKVTVTAFTLTDGNA